MCTNGVFFGILIGVQFFLGTRGSMNQEIETKEDLVNQYSAIMADLVGVLVNGADGKETYLSNVEFHFDGFSHRVFASYVNGKFTYIDGKPGIYLRNDIKINALDDDTIMVDPNDTNVVVIPCASGLYYAYQYPLHMDEVTNEGNRGWNPGYFVVSWNNKALEKQMDTLAIEMNAALKKYRACMDFEGKSVMCLMAPEFDFYSAKPFEKERSANDIPTFKKIYDTWKALTFNNNASAWCYMAYQFTYLGSPYKLTCGNLVEYDIYYRDANEKVKKMLEDLGCKNIHLQSQKVM